MRNNVRYYRLYKGVSQRWLAQKAGCSHSTLWAIERGESAPNVYLALRIALALDATVEELWRENHDR